MEPLDTNWLIRNGNLSESAKATLTSAFDDYMEGGCAEFALALHMHDPARFTLQALLDYDADARFFDVEEGGPVPRHVLVWDKKMQQYLDISGHVENDGDIADAFDIDPWDDEAQWDIIEVDSAWVLERTKQSPDGRGLFRAPDQNWREQALGAAALAGVIETISLPESGDTSISM